MRGISTGTLNFYEKSKHNDSPPAAMIESNLDIDEQEIVQIECLDKNEGASPKNGQSLTSKFSTIQKDEDSQASRGNINTDDLLMNLQSEMRDIEDIVDKFDKRQSF